jgi:hypothetical protein
MAAAISLLGNHTRLNTQSGLFVIHKPITTLRHGVT